MKVLTAAEMAAMDTMAVEQYGVPSLILMENAGRAVAAISTRIAGDVEGKKIALFCGKGNNGGDGLVAARHLLRMGARPVAFLLGSFQDLKADPRTNLDAAGRAGVTVRPLTETDDLEDIRREVHGSTVVIDAIFGTGFKPPARGFYADVISFMNDLGLPILSVDIPSGLSADHGRLEGKFIAAAHTITFGLPKVGQFLYPAAKQYGRLSLADIGFPEPLEQKTSASHYLITPRRVRSHLSPRQPDTHKGSYGHTLLLAGSSGFVGASVLAARGALRAGVGLVTVALPESQTPPSLDSLPEAMLLKLPETSGGTPGEQALEVILENLRGKQALAVGPGLSRNAETARLVRALIPQVRVPMVIDADGLNALTDDASVLLESASDIVVTPHPGELGRLLGISSGAIQERRIECALEFSKKYGVLVALKGAHSLVASPSGQVLINPTGNPGMASGGMGDVLTGVISSLIAQGQSPLEATTAGMYLHGLAGDLAAAAAGPWGYLAGEVADRIPSAVRAVLSPEGNEKKAAGDIRDLVT